MSKKFSYTGKDIIDYIKEEGLETVTIKCSYIRFKDETIDNCLTINWGKKHKRRTPK